VFGLARNVFLMNRRAARRWAEVHESRAELPEFPVFPEANSLGSRDEIRRGLACLSADRAEALLLHYEWGFTFDEIAGMLGITAGMVKNSICLSTWDFGLLAALEGISRIYPGYIGLRAR
jgi:DNA-directed RNA polymerase specialized sigma24 family protein